MMSLFADLIATSLLPHIVIDILFVAIVLGVPYRFLKNNS